MSNISDENKLWNIMSQTTKDVHVMTGPDNPKLPSFGWIHACYFCYSPTSRVKILYRAKSTKEYYVFQCVHCKDKIIT